MCGIFGIVYRDGQRVPDEAKLRATATLLEHRGPDAFGIYARDGVGLTHTRLSLVDLGPRSNQPFWDSSGRYALIFNGEIYNFKELRAQLEKTGRTFRTTSDTEVLLEGALEWGFEALLPRLDGMFAFAVLDTVTGSVQLARDRFGTKPLYMYEGSDFVAFASEVKAFRPWVELEPEAFAIGSYLLGFGGPMRGQTMYRRVRTVGTGTSVEIGPGGDIAEATFFTMPDFWDADRIESLESLSPAQTVDRFDEALNASVERQIFADARVGAFCSGGVDSSLIMAIAARKHTDLAIFHADVMGRWSESTAAKQLASHLKLDLNIVEVQEQDFVDQIPEVMRHYEHPFTYHPNCAPFMLVSRLARDHGVKGLLSGEGSDECFLGYPWLGRERITNAYYGAGRRLRRWVRAVPQVGPLLWPWDEARPDTIRGLFNRFETAEDIQDARARAASLTTSVPEGNIRSVEYLGYHLRTLLHRNDSLGMEASIESRFPFLDLEVVAAAVNTPYRHKIRYSPFLLEKAHPFVRDKWVVREVANRYLPRQLSQRTKLGFWTTAFERMRVSERYFDDSFPRELFGLSRKQLGLLIQQSDPELVVRLLHLDVWARVCLRGEPVDGSIMKLRDHVRILPDSR